jgi:hypothetical protein
MNKDDVGRVFPHSTDDIYELIHVRAGKKGGVSRVPYVLSPARAARIRHIEEVQIWPTKETAKVRVHINV